MNIFSAKTRRITTPAFAGRKNLYNPAFREKIPDNRPKVP
jgi:hypothetical protein